MQYIPTTLRSTWLATTLPSTWFAIQSTVQSSHENERETDDALLRSLLCARPGKVPVAAGEVDDDPARMRLKRGRAYREMAMKWCFRAGRPIADEEDSGDELHAVEGEDGVLRFNEASTNSASNASGEESREPTGALNDTHVGVAPTTHALDPTHASHGALDDVKREAEAYAKALGEDVRTFGARAEALRAKAAEMRRKRDAKRAQLESNAAHRKLAEAEARARDAIARASDAAEFARGREAEGDAGALEANLEGLVEEMNDELKRRARGE